MFLKAATHWPYVFQRRWGSSKPGNTLVLRVVGHETLAEIGKIVSMFSPSFMSADRDFHGRLGLSLDAANQLYVDTMRSGAPRCPAWERSVGHMVDMVDMVQA